jgi:hypothetical protein
MGFGIVSDITVFKLRGYYILEPGVNTWFQTVTLGDSPEWGGGMHILTPEFRLPKIHFSALLETFRKIHGILTENMVLYQLLKCETDRPLKACITIRNAYTRLDARCTHRLRNRRYRGNHR